MGKLLPESAPRSSNNMAPPPRASSRINEAQAPTASEAVKQAMEARDAAGKQAAEAARTERLSVYTQPGYLLARTARTEPNFFRVYAACRAEPSPAGLPAGFHSAILTTESGELVGPTYEVPGEMWFPGACPDSPVPRSSVRLARATGEPFPLVDLDNYQSAQPHRWAVEMKSSRFTKPPFTFLWETHADLKLPVSRAFSLTTICFMR